ncbi:MAG: thioredoxin family protein [Desulfobaccales bacterium]|jgi:uncharacterized protein YyaL (SSP411 family)
MGEINWRDSWPSALEEAQRVEKRILLELYLDGCTHCTRLHNETHIDDKVANTVNSKFIPVRLESRSNMDLVKQYNVTGAPTTLVLAPDGKELQRFAGYRSPREYLEELEKAI